MCKRTNKYICFHAHTCTANRTDPTLGDLQQAFNDLGIHLSDLSDFTREVESLSLIHHIPLYPAPRTSSHIHQLPPGSETLTRQSRRGSLSSEDEIERERIPSYFPPLPSKNEDKGPYNCILRMHVHKVHVFPNIVYMYPFHYALCMCVC